METDSPDDITEILNAWEEGDKRALDLLFSSLYPAIHRLVHFELRRGGGGAALQTTELLNESYIRLSQQRMRWRNRAHFFGVAVQVIRRVLVDLARKQCAQKRGSGKTDVALEDVNPAAPMPVNLVDIDHVLRRLTALSARQSQIVELRFFGGLTIEETADVLGVSSATVKREWNAARAWMRRELATL